MSHGDKLRYLCRELRRFRETKGRDPKARELASCLSLSAQDFRAAMQLGVDERLLIYDDQSQTVSEGEKLREVPTIAELRMAPTKMFAFSPGQQPLWERIFLALLVLAFLSILSILVFQSKELPEQNWKIVRVFMALLTASIGAFLPGMFLVHGNRAGLAARATGAFACFLVVLWAV